jgi:glycolate oxidase
MRAVKYGVTRDYVRALELVKSDGTIINLGGKTAKDASGLSLKDLVTGSEGTLGIITKCTLRLLPLPKHKAAALIAFDSLEKGVQAVHRIIMAGTDPVGLEFIERDVVELGERYTGLAFPGIRAAAYIILSYDGDSPEALGGRLERARRAAAGAADFLPLEDGEALSRVWQIRGCLVKAVEAVSEQEPMDIVVPINRIGDFVDCVHALEAESGVRAVIFGHAGDGNVHLCLLREGRAAGDWERELDGLLDKLYRRVYGMGGLAAGEHGIGLSKRRYFLENTPPENLELMRGIKRAFDPRNILNPGRSYAGQQHLDFPNRCDQTESGAGGDQGCARRA